MHVSDRSSEESKSGGRALIEIGVRAVFCNTEKYYQLTDMIHGYDANVAPSCSSWLHSLLVFPSLTLPSDVTDPPGSCRMSAIVLGVAGTDE